MSKTPKNGKGTGPSKSGSGSGSGVPPGGFKSAQPHLLEAMEQIRPALVNTVLQLPDQAQAEAHLKSTVNYAYLSMHGIDMGAIEAELGFAEADLAAMDKALEEIDRTLSETPQYLAASPLNQNRTDASVETVPFGLWSFRHKIETLLLSLGLPAMLATSAITTYSALMASGLPVFLENSVLALAMSGLPAFGAIALKSMGSLFRSDKAHRRFAMTVYGLAAVSLATWGAAFADQFHGVGGGALDIFGDEAPVWKEKLLVGAQLASEVLLGTAFFVRFERIARAYDPDAFIENLDYVTQTKHRDAADAARLSLRQDVAQQRGEDLSHQSALALQIELALISYRAKRARGSDPTI